MSQSFISVHVQTSGPYPGDYSLLTIGACLIKQPKQTFYMELKPLNNNYIPHFVEVTDLSWGELNLHGHEPIQGITQFKEWVESFSQPVFVALNTPFYWSFIHYYFMKYAGKNPFGFSALDIRSYAMGKLKTPWQVETLSEQTDAQTFTPQKSLQEALKQAKIFQMLFE